MAAEYPSTYDGCQGQAIEDVHECPPHLWSCVLAVTRTKKVELGSDDKIIHKSHYLHRGPSLALVIESIHLVQGRCLVVSSQQENAIRPFYLPEHSRSADTILRLSSDNIAR